MRRHMYGSLLITMLNVSCTATQQHGPRIIMSEREQVQAGRLMLEALEQENLFVRAGPLPALVQNIGNALVPLAGDSAFAYRFEILDAAEANAFALPGGTIVVTRGLLQLVNRPDELAAVLAHEIGHVSLEHAAWRMARALPITILASSLRRATRWASEELADAMAQAVTGRLLAPYAQEQEREADRVGISLAASAGYDPNALRSILGRAELLREVVAHDTNSASTDWASHPPTTERLQLISILANTMATGPSHPADEPRWRCAVDGSPFGVDMAAGLLHDHTFIAPALGITFEFPDAWQLAQSEATVIAMTANARPVLRVWRQMPRQAEQTLAALRREQPTPVITERKLGDVRVIHAKLQQQGERSSSHWWWFVGEEIAVAATGEAHADDEPALASLFESAAPLATSVRETLTTQLLRQLPPPPQATLTEATRLYEPQADLRLSEALNDTKPDAPAPNPMKLIRQEPWANPRPSQCP